MRKKYKIRKENIFILKQEYVSVVMDDIDDLMPYKKGSTEYVDKTLKNEQKILDYINNQKSNRGKKYQSFFSAFFGIKSRISPERITRLLTSGSMTVHHPHLN